jgi:hypothetical protein
MAVRPSSTLLGPPQLPRSWRPVVTRAVFLGLAVVTLLLFCTMAVIGPDNWQRHDRIAFGLTGLLFALALVLLARPVAKADRRGLTVVNFVHRRRLEWAEIVGVQLRRGDPWVLLDLSDGSTLAVVAIQPGAGLRQAVRAARELRACVDAYGTAPR